MQPEQRVSFITLGVDDLEATKQFYITQFGWTPVKDDGIVFFKMNGFILGLFPRHELAADAGVSGEGSGFKGITLAYNARSEAEVDAIMERLAENGVRIVTPAEKVFWGGYRGYIADNENNLWEIAYNPFLDMDEAGNVIYHK